MQRRVRALDGAEAEVVSATMDITGRATSSIRGEVGGILREFTAGLLPDGLSDGTFDVLGIPADRSYAMLGGNLVVGSGVPHDPEGHISDFAWAIWSAEGLGIFAHFYGEDDTAIMSTIAAISPRVDGDAILIEPESSIRFVETPDIALADHEFGVLNIRKLTRRVANRLPSWEGARVPGGQLYADLSPTGSCHITLVSDTAAAFLTTNSDLEPDYCVQQAAGLQIGWS